MTGKHIVKSFTHSEVIRTPPMYVCIFFLKILLRNAPIFQSALLPYRRKYELLHPILVHCFGDENHQVLNKGTILECIVLIGQSFERKAERDLQGEVSDFWAMDSSQVSIICLSFVYLNIRIMK